MISIIIPSKDRLAIVKQCLDSVIDSIRDYTVEVIVINDSKTLDLKSNLSQYSFVKVYDNPKSGVASARNLGASKSTGEWLLFLDDDMLMNAECLTAYLSYTNKIELFTVNVDWMYPPEVLEKIEKIAFGRFLIECGFTTLQGWNNFKDYPKNATISTDGITSQNLFIRATDFRNSGGYNETFPMAGYEDYAFSCVLKSKGVIMYIDTHSQMFHNELDRLTLSEWLARKERAGKTRRVAVDLGYSELNIKYSIIKQMLYKLIIRLKPFFFILLELTPNIKIADFFYFKIIKILLGAHIYKGYNSI